MRLAWTLRKSIQEVLALPKWERVLWRNAFSLYGPLDWRREDLLFAALTQMQSTGEKPLGDFVLFPEPAARAAKEEREWSREAILARFGAEDGDRAGRDGAAPDLGERN